MLNSLKILLALVLISLATGCTDWNLDPEDIEAPDPVTVTITAVTDTSVTVNWTESLDNKFLSYTVYYDEISPVDTMAANAVDTIFLKQDTHKTISGLKSKTQYFFRVAVNSTVGSASFSSEVDTMTFESISDKKLALAINNDKTNENTISLSWSKDWEDQYGDNDYVVYFDTTSNVDTSDSLLDTLSDRNLIVDSLKNSTPYFFRVYQLRDGVPSAGSNVVGDTTTKGEPAAVKLLSTKAGNNSVTLSWSESIDTSDFKRYFIVLNTVTAVDTFTYYDSNAVNVFPIDSINITTIEIDSIGANSLEMNTIYWFSVYVEDFTGNVTPTAPDSITTDDGIADPVAVEIDSVTNSSVTLNWTQNQDADFYQYMIYLRKAGSVTEKDTLIDTLLNQKSNSYKVTGLNSETKYYFYVSVKSKYGIATPSNEVVNFPVILEYDLDTTVTETDTVNDTSYIVKLIWQEGRKDYNEENFRKYIVYRSVDSFNSVLNAEKKKEIPEIEKFDYLDTAVVKGNKYHYRIFHQSLDIEGFPVDQFSNEVVVEVK